MACFTFLYSLENQSRDKKIHYQKPAIILVSASLTTSYNNKRIKCWSGDKLMCYNEAYPDNSSVLAVDFISLLQQRQTNFPWRKFRNMAMLAENKLHQEITDNKK